MASQARIALDLVLKRRELAESLAELWAASACDSHREYEPFNIAVLVEYLAFFPSQRIVDAMALTVDRIGRFEPAYCVGILRNWLRE